MSNIRKSEEKYIQNLKNKIQQLKGKRDAVIIAHNYQREGVQDIADIIGDSLALSKAAREVESNTIVFCGVHFMAESAAILNPQKEVLLPVKEAGCPLADMATVEKIRKFRQEYPDAAVVCYVNTSAAIKAESDVCCTSSNAIEVTRRLEEKEIIFLPDKNLGNYVKMNVPEKNIILWPGFCSTHIRLMEEEVKKVKKQHPDADFLVHPECRPEVITLADAVCSTGGMFKYVKSSTKKKFIIGTEKGLIYRLQKENSDKIFILPSQHLICANMKLTTLGWVAHALEFMEYQITVPENIRKKALKSLERMLEMSS